MTDRPKLLWHSNAPHSQTGYGVQTAVFTPKLKEHYDLGISAFYGLEGAPLKYDGIPVYPGLGQTHGNETILEHARVHFDGDHRAGLTMTLLDVWVLDPDVWANLNTACWCPVDHDPCPPQIADFFERAAAVPIAMSRFGQDRLRNAGLDPLYVPHGIPTEIFRPLDKQECRKTCKFPQDAFIVGCVAANKGNPSRKAFVELLTAFKRLHDEHDEALLYLHTDLAGRYGGGIDLRKLIDLVGVPRDAVMFCDQYRAVYYPFPQSTLAKLYSSMDVLAAASYGEGFGIPSVEAQACGVPVVLSDFAASAELCGAGWKVSGRPFFTPLDAYQFLPEPDDIYDALKQAYGLPAGTRKNLSAQAVEFARQYDAEHVFQTHMLPAIQEATDRFDKRKPMELVAEAMVWSGFEFFNELDVLEIKLGTLDPVVDKFVISEAPVTHAGNPKPLHLQDNWDRYERWHDKIIHVIDAKPVSSAWGRERQQRSALSNHIHPNFDDLVMVSDCDEIPDPTYWPQLAQVAEAGGVAVPRLAMHVMALRWRWAETWPGGARLCTGETLHKQFRGDVNWLFQTYNANVQQLWNGDASCVMGSPTPPTLGWHLAYMGGVDGIRSKFEAFAHQEFNRPPYNQPEHIRECIKTGADLLGRPERRAMRAPRRDLPPYVVENWERFRHLW